MFLYVRVVLFLILVQLIALQLFFYQTKHLMNYEHVLL